MPKNNLAEALNKVANRTPQLGRAHTDPAIPEQTASHREGKTRQSALPVASQRSKSRIGKKVISGFFDPQASKQLARLALDKDCTNEDLLREALNDLFIKYRLPPIA